jgi:hypothetical protein
MARKVIELKGNSRIGVVRRRFRVRGGTRGTEGDVDGHRAAKGSNSLAVLDD